MTSENSIIEANRALYAFENAADDLRDCSRDLNGLSALIDDFDRLEAAHEQNTALIEKIKAAKARQEAKASDPAFQHLIAAE